MNMAWLDRQGFYRGNSHNIWDDRWRAGVADGITGYSGQGRRYTQYASDGRQRHDLDHHSSRSRPGVSAAEYGSGHENMMSGARGLRDRIYGEPDAPY